MPIVIKPIEKKKKIATPKRKPKPGTVNESQSKSPYTVKDGKMVLDPQYKSAGGMIYKGR